LEITFFHLASSTLLVWLNLVPKYHPKLAIFHCAGYKDVAFFFELLYCLWRFFPGLFERSDWYATALAGVALDLG